MKCGTTMKCVEFARVAAIGNTRSARGPYRKLAVRTWIFAITLLALPLVQRVAAADDDTPDESRSAAQQVPGLTLRRSTVTSTARECMEFNRWLLATSTSPVVAQGKIDPTAHPFADDQSDPGLQNAAGIPVARRQHDVRR